MEIKELRCALLGVSAYRELLERPVLRRLRALLDALAAQDGDAALSAYAALFHALKTEAQPGLGHWFADALAYADGPWPRLAEAGGTDAALEAAAHRDVALFQQLAAVDCGRWLAELARLSDCGLRAVEALPRWTAEAPFDFDALSAGYAAHGAGEFGRCRAFVWEDGALLPVAEPDCPAAGELLGYEAQRQQVWENTRALLAGCRVNNVLLYGESGTGKSATVKNLLTLPGTERLRLIEADKVDLGGLPTLIRSLRGRAQKFILFIDDLTFDRDDSTYSVLKTILEGGVERRPDNVAIYATSNRRHLTRQTISERAGDEMDRNETIREKTSLADRFGLRILFQGLDKQAYLDTVDLLAGRYGLRLDPEELHRQAVAWERSHGAQTPRTALQFVLSLR